MNATIKKACFWFAALVAYLVLFAAVLKQPLIALTNGLPEIPRKLAIVFAILPIFFFGWCAALPMFNAQREAAARHIKKANGRSYLIRSVLVVAIFAILGTIECARIFASEHYSQVAKIGLVGFILALFAGYVSILRRRYKDLPSE